MSECKHEPWMHPGNELLGIDPRPWDVSGMLKPPAHVCKHCGVCYVPAEVREAFQRSAEKASTGRQHTVGSTIAEALQRRKAKGSA